MTKVFALYDQSSNCYISYRPDTEEFVPVGDIADLKIWDVWDQKMIPHILNEKGINPFYSVKELSEKALEKLSFNLW